MHIRYLKNEMAGVHPTIKKKSHFYNGSIHWEIINIYAPSNKTTDTQKHDQVGLIPEIRGCLTSKNQCTMPHQESKDINNMIISINTHLIQFLSKAQVYFFTEMDKLVN